MKYKSQQSGQTMLETILYIGFLIILAGIIAKSVASMFTRYNTGRATSQIMEIKKIIVHYTAIDEDYTKLDHEEMEEKNIFPHDLKEGYHALRGEFEVGSVGDGTEIGNDGEMLTSNKYLFYITYYNISKNACREILADGQFYKNGTDLDTLIVNDTTGWYYEHSYYDLNPSMQTYKAGTTLQPSIDEISKACSKNTDNTITWIFS